MNVVVLTTDTPHHRYYLARLRDEAPAAVQVRLVVFEGRGYPWRRKAMAYRHDRTVPLWRRMLLNPYVQPAALESSQRAYEYGHGFPPPDAPLATGLPVQSFHSANDDDCRAAVATAEPDLILVYGTGVLKPETYSIGRLGAINAHGGLLPRYRGLDTNLWAALEGRPDDMAVALHQVDQGIDTGPVFAQERLGRPPDLCLRSLRFHTARLCTDMTIALLRRMCESGMPEPEPQQGEGTVYGPMPALFKMRADRSLRAYAASPEVEAA